MIEKKGHFKDLDMKKLKAQKRQKKNRVKGENNGTCNIRIGKFPQIRDKLWPKPDQNKSFS